VHSHPHAAVERAGPTSIDALRSDVGLISELNGQGWPALHLSCAYLGGFLCSFPPGVPSPGALRLPGWSFSCCPLLSLQGQDDPIAIRFNGFFLLLTNGRQAVWAYRASSSPCICWLIGSESRSPGPSSMGLWQLPDIPTVLGGTRMGDGRKIAPSPLRCLSSLSRPSTTSPHLAVAPSTTVNFSAETSCDEVSRLMCRV
jgi:hypothetical protein